MEVVLRNVMNGLGAVPALAGSVGIAVKANATTSNNTTFFGAAMVTPLICILLSKMVYSIMMIKNLVKLTSMTCMH